MKHALLTAFAALLETVLRLVLVAVVLVALALRLVLSAGVRAAAIASAWIMSLNFSRRIGHA